MRIYINGVVRDATPEEVAAYEAMVDPKLVPAPPSEAEDISALIVDHEYRLTMLELGLAEYGGKQMLYRTLKRMIERGQTDGMEDKLDIFYAAGKLTETQYTELIGMLHPEP